MATATDFAIKIAPKSHVSTMRCKGFMAQLMQAQRLPDVGRAHGLPPGHPVPTYPIDALPGCPEEWVREPGSYVCPVSSAWGLWFDWTMNDHENTAVVASVKGMNPITGRKLEGLALEKYVEKCPVHNIQFAGDGRFCKECNYKWPPQSYISHPNVLWWDGFRQADGTVRQFFFTKDDERDIASLVIGKKNTVPAFGFVFYEPKVKRVTKIEHRRGYSSIMSFGSSKGKLGGPSGQSVSWHNSVEISAKHMTDGPNQVYCNACVTEQEQKTGSVLRSANVRDYADDSMEDKDVSVGAGAEISQDLREDNTPLTDWKEEPAAMIRLYFVFRKKFEQIVERGGLVDLNGNKDGYLKGLPVG